MGMLKPMKSFLPVKWSAGLLVVFLAWQGVVLLSQLRPREYTEAEKMAISRVCKKAQRLADDTLDSKRDLAVESHRLAAR